MNAPWKLHVIMELPAIPVESPWSVLKGCYLSDSAIYLVNVVLTKQ